MLRCVYYYLLVGYSLALIPISHVYQLPTLSDLLKDKVAEKVSDPLTHPLLTYSLTLLMSVTGHEERGINLHYNQTNQKVT